MCAVFELAAQAFSRAFNCLMILRTAATQRHHSKQCDWMTGCACLFFSLSSTDHFEMLIFYMLQIAISRSTAVDFCLLFLPFQHLLLTAFYLHRYQITFSNDCIIRHWCICSRGRPTIARWLRINDFQTVNIEYCTLEFHDDFHLIFVNTFLGIIVQHLISDTSTHKCIACARTKTSPKTYAHADGIAVFEMDVIWWNECAQNATESHLKIIFSTCTFNIFAGALHY